MSDHVIFAQVPEVRTMYCVVLDSETDNPVPGARIALVRLDSAGQHTETGIGGVTNSNGILLLALPPGDNLALQIRSIGYESTLLNFGEKDDSVSVYLFPNETFVDGTEITGRRRSRSVEDGCCRVESIRDEVQQHAPFSPSAVESLRRYSSCTSGRTINTIDNAGTISLRGLEPTRVGLMIDGMPLISGLGTFYGLSLIPSHAIQTVQIAEGASSAAYGNGAVSGIVDIQTRMPTEESELNGSINLLGDGISPDQYDLNGSYTGLIGDVGLALFGSFNDHQLSVPDGSGRLERKYRRFSGLAKGNMLLDDMTEIVVTLLAGKEERTGVVEQTEISSYRHRLDLSRIDALTRLSRLVGEDGEIVLGGGIARYGIEGDLELQRLDATQTILFGEAIWSDVARSHDYRIGLQGRSDKLAGEGEINDLDHNIHILSMFAQDIVPLGDHWTILGSLRADRHSDAGFLLSPRGSVRYAFSENFSMRLMGGSGFKGEGTFDEDYRSIIGSMRWQPNDQIDFERSFTLNYDITWSWTPSTSIGGNGNLNFYHTWIDQKLVPDRDSLLSGTLFYRNSDQPARLLGLEWQTRATIAGGWSSSLAVALIDYRLMNPQGEWEEIPLSPRFNIDAGLTWYREDLGLTLESWGSLIGSQVLPYKINGESASPMFGLFNLRVEKEIGPFAIFAGTLNLLDARQNETMPLVQTIGEVPDGSIGWGPAEGREFFLGGRLRMVLNR